MPPDYIRQLEDACLFLWEELHTDQFVKLRKKAPALSDFVAHLGHALSHEEATMRHNVWLEEP